jgi:hypothetical protein
MAADMAGATVKCPTYEYQMAQSSKKSLVPCMLQAARQTNSYKSPPHDMLVSTSVLIFHGTTVVGLTFNYPHEPRDT